MKKLTVLFLAMALGAIIGWPSRSTLSQSQVPNVPLQIANVGKVTNSYRKEWPGPRPSWVDVGLSRSTAHLRANQTSLGLANPDAELTLLAADQDDLGMTHVRLDQMWNGVSVFGGQMVVHLDAMDKASLSPLKFNFTTGRVFKDARQVNTNALIPGSSAIALAKADLRYTGTFTNRPEAKLVILPEAVKTDRDVSGAKLAYQIDLSIEDGSDAAGLQRYFVDARDGSIVWHYDAMPRQGSAQGTGNSLYSGQVNITTYFDGTNYLLQDTTRGGLFTTDVFNTDSYDPLGTIFTDSDNVWGNGNNSDRATAGVDAYFAAEKTYDYYYNRFQRRSFDNNNFPMVARVHWGQPPPNGNGESAQWNPTLRRAQFGEGYGVNYGPMVSLDIVGHELTHGLTQFTAGLSTDPSLEATAANESFSDIFGTMIEFSASSHPNYKLGEDAWKGAGTASRYMDNPRLDCQYKNPCSIDHYSQINTTTNPHYRGGLQNVAFFLLAVGGNHPSSNVSVKTIGRDNAAAIYFRALTMPYVPSTAHFSDVRAACEFAARDIFSTGNPIYQALQKSWYASGVGSDVPVNSIDDAHSFVRQQYLDFLNREPDQFGWDFWTNEITSSGNDAVLEDQKRTNVSLAFFLSVEFQQTGYLVERIYKTAYGDASGTSTYPSTHQVAVPIVRLNEFLPDAQQIGQGVVVGQTGWETVLENNKQNFTNQFVQRSRFTAAYPTSMTPATFVDALNQKAGNVLSSSERTTAINLFGGAGDTSNTTARAQALRQVAEDQDLYNAKFNRAFVLMQYFGFLRRNPNDSPDSDYTGYDFWTSNMNQIGSQQQADRAFIVSTEYRSRFGPA